MVETIMGEGGIKVVPDFCIKGLRDICDEHGILLILDEVQSAYRTGNFFAFEKPSGIIPDIVPIAKGIGGGFPLGACLVHKKGFCWHDSRNTWKYIWRQSISNGSGQCGTRYYF